ncbi:MAG: chemotaxis protein CheB [Mariprofundus sp.]|nr:chemotaxis protein CheB [Mariprofundus sp.]
MAVLKTLVMKGDAKSRWALVDMIHASENIEVVGVASEPMLVRVQLRSQKPDVLLLAIDPQQVKVVSLFLTELMHPQTVHIVALLSRSLIGSEIERQLLSFGSIALLTEPDGGLFSHDYRFQSELLQHILHRSVHYHSKALEHRGKSPLSASKTSGEKIEPRLHKHTDKLIALGASTGGTEALRQLVAKFPADFPAVLIVQHITTGFSASFIDSLNRATAMRVVAATDGLAILRGHIYVGAGDHHFRIKRQTSGYICRLKGQKKLGGHCPAVDELFLSLAMQAGSNAVGVLMTGMGDDGARGLKKMLEAKAMTLAQNKESSVIWGMPGAAVKIGAVQEQCHLDDLGDRIIQLLK